MTPAAALLSGVGATGVSSDQHPPLSTTVYGSVDTATAVEFALELPLEDDVDGGASSPAPEEHSLQRTEPSIAPPVAASNNAVFLHRQVVPGIGIKPDPKEAKRLRRSEIEKRSRQRRQGSVSGMREELDRLERQYELLTNQGNDGDRRGVIIRPNELPTLRKRFLQLSNEATALREERTSLRGMLHERQLFSDSMKALMTQFSENDALSWNTVAHAKYEPLQTAHCFELMRDAYDTIARFENTRNFITSGSSVLGWTDKRQLDENDGKMYFSFTKQYASGNCERCLDDSWEMFRDEKAMRRTIFSAGVEVNLELLQTVSDDVLVMRRHTKYVAMGRAFHTVYLLFRVQTENGYTLCFRTIPCPAIQNALEEGESWIELFHWSQFQRLPGGGMEVSFGGSLGGAVLKFAMHWMIELIMTVIRWENACVAPVFITAS